MESYEVLREVFQQVSPKAIASELSVSLSLVYKWAEKPQLEGGGHRNPLDRVVQLMDLCPDDAVLEWLCQRNGGCFVPNPNSPKQQDMEVLPATHEIIQQFSGLLRMISTAAVDNTITAQEAAEIRDSWDQLKSYTEGFVRCCEQGDFNELKQIPSFSHAQHRR